MKKYLPIIIFASAFVGFVAYATVKTQQAENKKLTETNNAVEEIVESSIDEFVNGDDIPTDNFIPDNKEIPNTSIKTIIPQPIFIPTPVIETPIPEVIETPQTVEEPTLYFREKENEDEDDD